LGIGWSNTVLDSGLTASGTITGATFWGYDHYDIYAGIFAPYGYDDLTGYFSRYAGDQARRHRRGPASLGAPAAHLLAQMCGDDSRDIVDLPVDDMRQAMRLTDVQRAALDDLANALLKAAQDIKAACPTDVSLTAPNRLSRPCNSASRQ
jgi:hypothetical protein